MKPLLDDCKNNNETIFDICILFESMLDIKKFAESGQYSPQSQKFLKDALIFSVMSKERGHLNIKTLLGQGMLEVARDGKEIVRL